MFLALNGVEVRVADASEEQEPFGEDWRSRLTGRPRRRAKAHKRTWRFRSVPMTLAEAHACRGLIEGEGEAWTYDDPDGTPTHYSRTGRLYSSNVDATVAGGTLTVPTSISYVAAAETVTVTRLESAVWVHYVVRRGDGAKWVDGVRNDAADTSWLTVTAGSVELTGPVEIDDLVVLPYAIPDDWASQLQVSLPYLTASGDFAPAPVAVECLVDTVSHVQLGAELHATITFSMWEV